MPRAVLTSLLVVLILSVGFGLGMYSGSRLQRLFVSDTNDSTPVIRKHNPSGLGRIQPYHGLINIGGIPGDRISKLNVAINSRVKKGEELVVFASQAQRLSELKVATEQLAAALQQRARLNEAEKQKLTELRAQQARAKLGNDLKHELDLLQIPVAEQGFKLADDVLNGLRSLDPTRASVVAQDLQKAVFEQASAQAKLKAARLSAEAAKAQSQLDDKSIEASIAAVQAEFDLKRSALMIPVLEQQKLLAEERLNTASILAENDALVVRVLSQVGSTVGQEPIIQLADVSKMLVIAEVYVDDVPTLVDWVQTKKLVKVKISARSLPRVLNGTVSSLNQIDPIVMRNTLVGFSARSDTDRRIKEVRVDLDEESAKIAATAIGQQVDVMFEEP